jgi:hypothetical protein
VKLVFFANHLVRHDTIECTKWMTNVLPPNTPNFQSKLITLWAGPPKERKTAGVLKIYADKEDVNKLSDLLRNKFNDPNNTTFIPKEYFDTLNPQQKSNIISSQYEYHRLYRSVIIKGIKNAHLPTVTINNTPLSIIEWIKTVPDYQHRHMFLQITEVNHDELELRCLETNLHIAKKWARQATLHIATCLKPIQLSSAFTDSDSVIHNLKKIEVWNPPPPPTINFMPDPKNAWNEGIPKTITKHEQKKSNTKRKSNTYTREQGKDKDNENDNNTTTTVNTQASYTQATISELQNSSYQHQQLLDIHSRRIDGIDETIVDTIHYQQLVDSHTNQLESVESTTQNIDRRLDTIDRQFQERISTITNNLATIEEEQQVQQRQQEQMTRDIERNAMQLPTITENLEAQQKQLLKYFRRQNKMNRQTDTEIKKLRETQSKHETMIATLQAIVLQLQNSAPPTPLSQQRIRKRQKPRDLNETSVREDSDTKCTQLQH